MTTSTATFTKADIGCYFDGARGIYIGEAVQQMAMSHGWKYSSQFWMVYSEDVTGDQHCEEYDEAWTEAEDYLNTLTDDDVYFGSNESGDWGLWHICDDLRDDNCDFCESL